VHCETPRGEFALVFRPTAPRFEWLTITPDRTSRNSTNSRCALALGWKESLRDIELVGASGPVVYGQHSRQTLEVPLGHFPFPQNQRLAHCRYPSAADALDVKAAFERFCSEIVTSEGARGGLRTRRPDTPEGVVNSTVSEGIAYGMLIAVMLDEQTLFDGFWHYARNFFNSNGLMDWYIAPDGSAPLGRGAASDADEDMAWALVMADRQWGGCGSQGQSYRKSALELIDAIWRYEVDHSVESHLFIPGDDWRGRDVFNPSYFAPNQYRLFGEVTSNQTGWSQVIDRGYSVIERSLNRESGNAQNGLVPAWCNCAGEPVEAFPSAMLNYQTDSARLPFRMGQDWAYHREARAAAYLRKVSEFFAEVGANQIVDGYSLRGEPAPDPRSQVPNPGSAVFVGSAAVGAMHDPRYGVLVDEGYARVRTGKLLARSRYYNHCWTLLSLLMLSGNLVTFPQNRGSL
jgi:endo-1,4-beta-D-glucanase Y